MFITLEVKQWMNYRQWSNDPVHDRVTPETDQFLNMDGDIEKDFLHFRNTYKELLKYSVIEFNCLLQFWVFKSQQKVFVREVFRKNCYLLTEDQLQEFGRWIVDLYKWIKVNS